MKTRLILLALACLALASCSDNASEEGGKYSPKEYNVKGRVEKGPFVSGSTINLQPMDAKMKPTGSTFSSTITDHLGSFSFGETTLDAPFAQLTANGYFFNEVTGELSSGTLSLRAVVNLEEQSSVNVNILTHLKFSRILDLVEKDGKSYNEANKQAQKELMTAFGLQKYDGKDAASYSIASGTNEAGALIAISSLIQKGRTEAQMTEYLAKLSKEFGEMGTFSVATKEIIKNDRDALVNDLGKIARNIKDRYEELGQEVTVVPLVAFFDWDNDGVAGNEASDPNNPPQLSQTEISVPKYGGEYTVNITSAVPLYLECHHLGEDDDAISIISPSDYWTDIYDRTERGGGVYKTLEGSTLKINVSRTESKKESVTEIPLYDFVGNEVAKVTLTQDGDPDLPAPGLSKNAQQILAGCYARLASAMSFLSDYVNFYGMYSEARLRAPLNPHDDKVSSAWQSFYNVINNMLMFEKADKDREDAFSAPISVFYAIAYYQMVTLWGGVPYLTEPILDVDASYRVVRASQDDILNSLEERLTEAISSLEEKRNRYDTNINDVFFVSKDVARITLADIYMYRGKYNKAESLLKKVMSNGYYSLSESDEMIMGYSRESMARSFDRFVPLYTLSDVMLSLAECENSLGNTSAAWEYARRVGEYHGTFGGAEEPASVLAYISKVRELSMSSTIGRFAFLKRTGMHSALFDYYHPDFEFMLLFPIPMHDIYANPGITQNPGYDGSARGAMRRNRR